MISERKHDDNLMNGKNRKRETYRTRRREGKKEWKRVPGALVSFMPSNVTIIDYRFIVQVMLQMFHTRARLSLFSSCSPEYKSAWLYGETFATSIFATNSLSSH